MEEQIPEISALRLAEKRELMRKLSEEIHGPEMHPRDAATVALLKLRLRQYEADPSTAITLEDFRKRLPLSN